MRYCAVPQRILLIRLSAIGDVINTLPALSALRAHLPEAHLGFVVEDRARDLLVGHPHVNEVFVFPRQRWRAYLRSGRPRALGFLRREVGGYVRQLRAARFDVTLDFQGNLKGAVHALASGAPRRIGFARGASRELAHCFANERVVPPLNRPHRVEKFASLLGPLGVATPILAYTLPESSDARARALEFLSRSGLARERFVVVHPGTSDRGAHKRWPPERFAELAGRIVSELGAAVIVSHGPAEERLARDIVAAARGAALRAPSGGSLLELAETLRRAAAFVSADTGPMHLAAACGTPCVALFGPKDPAVYRPYGEGHVVIHRSDLDGTTAMQRITVEEVLAALRSVLVPVHAESAQVGTVLA